MREVLDLSLLRDVQTICFVCDQHVDKSRLVIRVLSNKYVSLSTGMDEGWTFTRSCGFLLALMDRIGIVLLSLAATAIMTVLLPWCLLCNVPLAGDIFDRVSRRVCNGLSIVNACACNISDRIGI